MNFKSLIYGSALALSIFSLTACGDDSTSNSSADSSSSAQELILSSASETSPFNSGAKLAAKTLSDGQGGWELSLTGTLEMDNNFIPEGGDEETDYWFSFDSLSFLVGSYADDGKVYVVDSLNINTSKINLPAERITLANIDMIPLNQEKIGCGKFVLYLWLYMSDDENHEFSYSAVAPIDFELQCKIEESSSSVAEVCTQMEKVDAELSNLLATDVFTMNFDGGADAQVTMRVEGHATYLDAAPGIKIWDETSYVGILPEEPVCLETFEKAYNSEKTSSEMSGLAGYLIVTPAGTYPLLVEGIQYDGDTNAKMRFVYYKKK